MLVIKVMEKFDVIVIGSGSGMIIVSNAVNHGMKTAVVEFGPMGGTCVNRGCIPSKMLIYPADVVTTIQEARKVDVKAKINSIDFRNIMKRMRKFVNEDSQHQATAVETTPNLVWFKTVGEFTSDYTMKVGEQIIKGDRIFIVSGARPGKPSIKGIETVNYLTSDTVLELEKPPKNIVIIGGGYIAAEYSHFFSSMGTQVTILQRSPRLIPEEEPEISDLLKQELEKRMTIFTNHEAIEAYEKNGIKTVVAKNRETSKLREFSAEALLVAAGRVPNSDILKPEKTGVQLDERGYIKVNEYLETSKANIWAFGDAIGREMFKHVANYEAEIAWHNAVHEHKVKMDYSSAPHAIFTHPQVASVGLKEAKAKQKGHKILVGKAFHKDIALGAAMGNPEGFVKVIVERDTGKLLGAHIIGPFASSLIQEIINVMVCGDKTFLPIIRAMHIHPALSEVVQRAFGSLREA
ncbi:dihydrolipoyl dehydrogenase [Candidatus Bathyarchaeota archaeon]|nr:dihydrolipoyl dehydrogenase [Candidatus Bathyarchaeota archaeon]